MGATASQITSLTIVYSTVYTGTDQRQHQSPMSLAFVRGIQRWTVNSLHKWPVTQKMFPIDDVIMRWWPLMQTPAARTCKIFNLLWPSNAIMMVSQSTFCGSGHGLLPDGTLRTYFNEVLLNIKTFSFKKMHLRILSIKHQPCHPRFKFSCPFIIPWTRQW